MESGSASEGMIVAERLRRKRKITITTRKSVSRRVNFTSLTEARFGAVAMDLKVDAGGQLAAELRQQRAHAVGDFDGVRAGLLLHGENERALVAEPRRRLVVLHVIEHAAELFEMHRPPVAPRH